jgi:hypothetical protein
MTPDDLRMLAAKMAGHGAPADQDRIEQNLTDSFARLDMSFTRQRSGQTYTLKGADGNGMSGISLADAQGILASLQEAMDTRDPE